MFGEKHVIDEVQTDSQEAQDLLTQGQLMQGEFFHLS